MDDGIGEYESRETVLHVENEAESIPIHAKTSATTLNFLDTCPACHLNFHSREPKLLPCLHSFCKKCLPSPSRNLAVADPPNTPVDSASKPLNVIRCPVCRQECMEVDVMENLFAKDSFEAPSSTVERSVQLCMTCDDNTEAAGFCVDCVEYLCATCVEAHLRVKFTKDHTIRQKEDVAQEVDGMSAQRPVFCDVHKQEPLQLFCETCDQLTCRDCQLLKHKDHNYQFLGDAYNNHKHHMESMNVQLQEKKKVIQEVSQSIHSGLQQVSQNRLTVHNEIKKAICGLILEIDKKGKLLVNQLEAVTRDHLSLLKKQQEDIGYLSRHLDHVIHFTKWATERNGGTAFLYCKRLILFQIGNLLRAKCNTSFVPQSSVRFQCRSSYWASNVDLGTLVVENNPGHALGTLQRSPHQLPHPGPGPPGSPDGLALGPRLVSHHTLAQLQMQVDKLNPQPHWQPPPTPPQWTWYQCVRLPRSSPVPVQGCPPSQSMWPHMSSQPGRRFVAPPPHQASPTNSLTGYPAQSVQPLRGRVSSSTFQTKPNDAFPPSPLYAHNTPLPSNGHLGSPQSRQLMDPTYLNTKDDLIGTGTMLKPNSPQSLPPSQPLQDVQGQQNTTGFPAGSHKEESGVAFSCVSEEKKRSKRPLSWKPEEIQPADVTEGSAAKRRRRYSPAPIIVIKDEPEDDISFQEAGFTPMFRRGNLGKLHATQRASLPDSTGDQPQIGVGAAGQRAPTPPQSTLDESARGHIQDPKSPGGKSEAEASSSPPSLGGGKQQRGTPSSRESGSDVCAVCHNGGELLRCDKCPKVFHFTCHVPSLSRVPSGGWICSFCRDLWGPQMVYDCDNKPEATTVKEEPHSEGGFPPMDKRKCERLLLRLFCSELSLDFQQPLNPTVSVQPQEDTNWSLTNGGKSVKTPMDLFTVKRRLEDGQSPAYRSAAEFIADIRLILRNHDVFNEGHSEVSVAGRKLAGFFEKELKILYPDRLFPEIKEEAEHPAPQGASPLSSLCGISWPPERRFTSSVSQDAPGSPKEERGTV